MEMLEKIYNETGIRYDSVSDINWVLLLTSNLISEDFIREFQDEVNWGMISTFQKLSEKFIIEFSNRVNWSYVSIYQKLSEDFIRENKNTVNWASISKGQHLSEDFIREFKNQVNWGYISRCQCLSESFIEEFKNSVWWNEISIHQKLSEPFIYRFKCYVSWENVVKYQKLSESFLKEYWSEIYVNNIVEFQFLSEDFREDFRLKPNKDNWLYKSKKYKKNKIKDCGLYECYDNYFIAYKSIRTDRYSHFNFQYQYLVGETYECHCDCTPEEDSFGLSAWTEEKAKKYKSKGLIVKVKVKYEDVGRIVNNNGKLRCFKIEILS